MLLAPFLLLMLVYVFVMILPLFVSLFLNSFILWSLLSYVMPFFLFSVSFFLSAVWSVAHTTLAVPWPVVPDTVCLLTPPRCTPSPRPAAQGQSWYRGPGLGPAQRLVDRRAHSPVANSQWARRRLMMMMMMMMPPTALRNLPTFQSVGECMWGWKQEEHVWEHQQMCKKTTKTKRFQLTCFTAILSLASRHI